MSGPRSQPRCQANRGENGCGRPIKWVRKIDVGVRKYDPAPVEGRTHAGVADPVENGTRAWRFRDLVEDLMVRRQMSREEAEDEAYAMPWYVRHQCRPIVPTQTERGAAWTG